MAFLALSENTGSNFQHLRARGHLWLCSLNRIEPGNPIKTTRQFSVTMSNFGPEPVIN